MCYRRQTRREFSKLLRSREPGQQLGRWSFHVAAPTVWNTSSSLSALVIRQSRTLQSWVETYIFNQAYTHLWERIVLRVNLLTYLLTYLESSRLTVTQISKTRHYSTLNVQERIKDRDVVTRSLIEHDVRLLSCRCQWPWLTFKVISSIFVWKLA